MMGNDIIGPGPSPTAERLQNALSGGNK